MYPVCIRGLLSRGAIVTSQYAAVSVRILNPPSCATMLGSERRDTLDTSIHIRLEHKYYMCEVCSSCLAQFSVLVLASQWHVIGNARLY